MPEDDQYIVEQILNYKVNQPKGYKKGNTRYLVKREGYLDKGNSLANEIYKDLGKACAATSVQLLRERNVRLGRQKKIVTQYLVKLGGYPDDQST
jgi:hypothetical protein